MGIYRRTKTHIIRVLLAICLSVFAPNASLLAQDNSVLFQQSNTAQNNPQTSGLPADTVDVNGAQQQSAANLSTQTTTITRGLNSNLAAHNSAARIYQLATTDSLRTSIMYFLNRDIKDAEARQHLANVNMLVGKKQTYESEINNDSDNASDPASFPATYNPYEEFLVDSSSMTKGGYVGIADSLVEFELEMARIAEQEARQNHNQGVANAESASDMDSKQSTSQNNAGSLNSLNNTIQNNPSLPNVVNEDDSVFTADDGSSLPQTSADASGSFPNTNASDGVAFEDSATNDSTAPKPMDLSPVANKFTANTNTFGDGETNNTGATNTDDFGIDANADGSGTFAADNIASNLAGAMEAGKYADLSPGARKLLSETVPGLEGFSDEEKTALAGLFASESYEGSTLGAEIEEIAAAYQDATGFAGSGGTGQLSNSAGEGDNAQEDSGKSKKSAVDQEKIKNIRERLAAILKNKKLSLDKLGGNMQERLLALKAGVNPSKLKNTLHSKKKKFGQSPMENSKFAARSVSSLSGKANGDQVETYQSQFRYAYGLFERVSLKIRNYQRARKVGKFTILD